MRSWPHSEFSVDQSVFLPAGDRADIERLVGYMTRCPFSLARVVRLTADGSVIYRAEQPECRRFPGPASGDLRSGPKRNFQVFSALDFLAEVTQHTPEKGDPLVRYYGWYSHRQRGIRAKATANDKPPIERSALDAEKSAAAPRAGPISTWARLIKRVYEVDPLQCSHCGGRMKTSPSPSGRGAGGEGLLSAGLGPLGVSLEYDAGMVEVISKVTARQASFEASLIAMGNTLKMSLLNYL